MRKPPAYLHRECQNPLPGVTSHWMQHKPFSNLLANSPATADDRRLAAAFATISTTRRFLSWRLTVTRLRLTHLVFLCSAPPTTGVTRKNTIGSGASRGKDPVIPNLYKMCSHCSTSTHPSFCSSKKGVGVLARPTWRHAAIAAARKA